MGAHDIATSQVELHPYLQNRTVAAFAREMGIHVTAYMPLAYGKVMDDPVVKAIDAVDRGERLISPEFAPGWD